MLGAVAVEEVIVGVCGSKNFWFMDAIAAGADEGTFDVSTEGFGAVFGTVRRCCRAKRREDLHRRERAKG